MVLEVRIVVPVWGTEYLFRYDKGSGSYCGDYMGVFFLKINLGVYLRLFAYFKFYILLLAIFSWDRGLQQWPVLCHLFALYF